MGLMPRKPSVFIVKTFAKCMAHVFLQSLCDLVKKNKGTDFTCYKPQFG